MGNSTFISYAREDAAFALSLAEGLRARGLALWVDLWNIETGADWDAAIDRGLHGCANFLIILSPDAVTSKEVRAELRTALNNRKQIFPVLYRQCEVPRQLLNVQYLDVSDSGVVTDAAFDHLARALRESAPANPPEARRDSGAESKPMSPASRPIPYLSRRELLNRRDVLDDVKSEAVNRLGQSLPAGGPIAIFKQMQMHQVQHFWEAAGLTAELVLADADTEHRGDH
jgi:hypothetical protein